MPSTTSSVVRTEHGLSDDERICPNCGSLMALYSPGTRVGLIDALTEMRSYLEADETELQELTDSTIAKLREIDDEAFAALELYPDLEV